MNFSIGIPSRNSIVRIAGIMSLFIMILMISTVTVIVISNVNALVSAQYELFTKWSSLGSGAGQFKHPIEIDIDSSESTTST